MTDDLRRKYSILRSSIYEIMNNLDELDILYGEFILSIKETLLVDDEIINYGDDLEINDEIKTEINYVVIPMINKKL